jgi:hypothetical protein
VVQASQAWDQFERQGALGPTAVASSFSPTTPKVKRRGDLRRPRGRLETLPISVPPPGRHALDDCDLAVGVFRQTGDAPLRSRDAFLAVRPHRP